MSLQKANHYKGSLMWDQAVCSDQRENGIPLHWQVNIPRVVEQSCQENCEGSQDNMCTIFW
jgi:hypothetical protein